MANYHLFIDESGKKRNPEDPYIIAGAVLSLKPNKATQVLKKVFPFVRWPLHGNLLNIPTYIIGSFAHWHSKKKNNQALPFDLKVLKGTLDFALEPNSSFRKTKEGEIWFQDLEDLLPLLSQSPNKPHLRHALEREIYDKFKALDGRLRENSKIPIKPLKKLKKHQQEIRRTVWSMVTIACQKLFSEARAHDNFLVIAAEEVCGSAIGTTPYTDRYIALFRVHIERVIDLLLCRDNNSKLNMTISQLPICYQGHRRLSTELLQELLESILVHQASRVTTSDGIRWRRSVAKSYIPGREQHPSVQNFTAQSSGGMVLADLIANRAYRILRSSRGPISLQRFQGKLQSDFCLQVETPPGGQRRSHIAAGPEVADELRLRRVNIQPPKFNPQRALWAAEQADTWL